MGGAARLREESRERKVEGFMLKRLGSPYRVGRRRGDWWKWKIDPYSVDCVLIYAQPGNGRRASLFTDYTFGVWDDGKLVPFAKAYSGLSDEEIREVDAFVRRNTIEKFGPVHHVKPELVFELAFEGIQKSLAAPLRDRGPISPNGALAAATRSPRTPTRSTPSARYLLLEGHDRLLRRAAPSPSRDREGNAA